MEFMPPFAQLLPHGLILPGPPDWLVVSTPRPTRQTVTLGCMWEVTPRNIEACPESICTYIADQHVRLLQGLPVGSAVQAIMLMMPARDVPAWEDVRHGIEGPVIDAQRHLFASGSTFREGSLTHGLRRCQTLVTLRLPPAPDIGADLLRTFRAQMRARDVEIAKGLQEVFAQQLLGGGMAAQHVEDGLVRAGHDVQRLSGEAMAHALCLTLRPTLQRMPSIALDDEVRIQVATQEARHANGTWTFGQGTTAQTIGVLTMHRNPTETWPGMLSAPRDTEEMDALDLWDAHGGPLALVVNIQVPHQPSIARWVKRKRLFAHMHRANAFKGSNPETKQMERELREFTASSFHKREALYPVRCHLVVYGPAPEVPRALDALQSRLGTMEMLHEESLAGDLFMQTLPLGFDPEWPSEQFLRRNRHMPAANLGMLMPLYGGTRGLDVPHVHYLNRRGEAVAYSPFADQTTRHALIIGATGAGKSFNMAYMINQLLPLSARIVVLDQLPSYKELCAFWGGSYVAMDFNAPICFNPFHGPLDQEHQAFITAVCAEMAGGQRDPLTQEQLGVLSDAVGSFVGPWSPGHGEPTLGLFDRQMLRTGSFAPGERRTQRIAEDLSRRLRMFVGTGHCAGFVDGPNTFRIGERLTVTALGMLSRFPALQGVILFIAMHLVSHFFTDPALLDLPKCFIGDESWIYLNNESTAEVLATIARAYRKLRTSAAFLSQQASDFDSPAGQVIRKNCELKLFLRQDPEEIRKMQGIFELTDAETAMIRQARNYQGWGSAYLKLPDYQGGMVRLVPDRATLWLCGQTAEHRRARDHFVTLAHGDYQRAFVLAMAAEGATYA